MEDDPADADLLAHMLQAAAFSYDLTRVERLSDAVRLLQKETFDVVLLDLALPDSYGLETVGQVREVASNVPIVVLSGLDDEALALRAVEEGCQDYLVKGTGIETAIGRSISYAIERKHAEERLAHAHALRAVGELASGMAHHLNNLLTIMLGRVQLLLLEVGDPEIRRSLTIVEQAILDGAAVVSRVLTFVPRKTSTGLRPVAVNLLVQEMLELTRSKWRDEAQLLGRRIEPVFEPGDVPDILADPGSLREVLMNILLNALDALPEGGRITLKTWSSENWVYCSVSDNGVGMTPEVRQRAHEPFFTTKGPKSTGLGLSVSHGILQRHGGDLAIESAEGRGTTVTITLPIARDRIIRLSAAADRQEPVVPLRILLIDDDAGVRQAVAEMLAAEGHDVVQATGGQEALHKLEAGQSVDIVLADLGMPGMTGWEMAKAVRARWPEIRIGIMTGWGEVVQTIPEEQTADFLLSKPVTLQSLYEALHRAPGR